MGMAKLLYRDHPSEIIHCTEQKFTFLVLACKAWSYTAALECHLECRYAIYIPLTWRNCIIRRRQDS